MRQVKDLLGVITGLNHLGGLTVIGIMRVMPSNKDELELLSGCFCSSILSGK